MKNSVLAFSVASALLTSLILCAFKTGFVAALAATSTSATSTEDGSATAPPDNANSTSFMSTSSTIAEGLLASTTATTTAAPGADNSTFATSALSATSSASQGASFSKGKPALKLVHVMGSKYVDFFTDGTTTYSFPGDSAIDANLNKPNASIPFHNGLTWVSTKAMEAYDTSSGGRGLCDSR